ncbi:Uncharacterised protein [Mycobacteroides abscessus subsp. abscessus]|nr:Uncharacterised protein [Mycobacteroides abscessus subsp. abscessus]
MGPCGHACLRYRCAGLAKGANGIHYNRRPFGADQRGQLGRPRRQCRAAPASQRCGDCVQSLPIASDEHDVGVVIYQFRGYCAPTFAGRTEYPDCPHIFTVHCASLYRQR